MEWLTAFVAAHDEAVSTKNIHGGFRGTSIHPFLPTKVLRRLASLPLPQAPPNPVTPFNEAVLTVELWCHHGGRIMRWMPQIIGKDNGAVAQIVRK